MIGVTVHSTSVELYVYGTGDERRDSARDIRGAVLERDRVYQGGGKWRITNPWKYSGNIPALKEALKDAQRQLSLFSAKDIAMVQDQKYAQFFFYLTVEEQLVILECAVAGLRDELADGWLRENDVLDLDMSDEALQPIHDKLDEFLDK